MITKESIEQVNKAMETIAIEKGKKVTNYVMVNERVKAFRQICPSGSIVTRIIECKDGVVTIAAEVRDETGHLLATGMAQEKESSSFINKTSYIENCETSAVGRALGFVGIGIDGSMASAEEVANAIVNQGGKVLSKAEKEAVKADEKTTEEVGNQPIDTKKIKVLTIRCKEAGIDKERLCELCKVKSLAEITEKRFLEIAQNWETVVKACR